MQIWHLRPATSCQFKNNLTPEASVLFGKFKSFTLWVPNAWMRLIYQQNILLLDPSNKLSIIVKFTPAIWRLVFYFETS